MLPPIKYTLCFLLYRDYVLLIYRKKAPWKDHWNGLGGKLEPGETKEESVIREMWEETGVQLAPRQVKYGGLLTWVLPSETLGLHLFTANVSKNFFFSGQRETREGILEWKTLDEVCDITNKTVAHNIPYFLPSIMVSTTPLHYHCNFKEESLQSLTTSPLPQSD